MTSFTGEYISVFQKMTNFITINAHQEIHNRLFPIFNVYDATRKRIYCKLTKYDLSLVVKTSNLNTYYNI